MVNELYADAAALGEHQNNPRKERLRVATGLLIKSRRVILAKTLDGEPEETGLAPDELNASNDD
jgi:quinol monooxygenase YgiN